MFGNKLASLKIQYPYIVEFLLKLEKTLSSEKFLHSIGVMITARKLMMNQMRKNTQPSIEEESKAVEQINKSVVAGLLHDCAKCLPFTETLSICETYGITKNDVGAMTPTLLHAPVGVFVAQRDYQITDVEILNAIRCHTTGRENMTLLEKVVFMADVVEPTRGLADAENIIQLINKDIDNALRIELDKSICSIVDKVKFLNLNTVNARNYLL